MQRRQFLPTLLMALLALLLHPSSAAMSPSDYYERCAPLTCGGSVLRWPFGLDPLCSSANLTTTCVNGTVVITDDQNPSTRYNLLQPLDAAAYSRRSVQIVDAQLAGCGQIPSYPGTGPEAWMSTGSMNLDPGYYRETVFNCTKEPSAAVASAVGLNPAPCLDCGNTTNICYLSEGYKDKIQGCLSFRVNIAYNVYQNISRIGNLRTALEAGFNISWVGSCSDACVATGGLCGYLEGAIAKNGEVCFCQSGVHRFNCSDGTVILHIGHGLGDLVKIVTGVATATILVAIICYISIRRCRIRRKRLQQNGLDEQTLRRYLESKSNNPSIEGFLQNYTSGMPTRFTYKQLKKYSNNFSHKVGQGGFGSVFRAELASGHAVAVKVLDETKQSEVQFLNEVQTVGRIHHDHLVRLLGYCFEGSKRALVYEFMENGSLDRYIHRKQQKKAPEKLNWRQLHEIAVGTAKGIAYLHEECRSRILHCDIKPHNILIDDKFRPKVSDFGLAQIVNRDHSNVSLAYGRGTPGYAPPEMWWKSCGPVTEKSDVYSFGMVLLEMVGGRRNYELDASRSSEAYFPEWFMAHQMNVANREESPGWQGDEEGGAGDNGSAVLQRMALVGLWCIQYSSAKRPSMRKAIEMLEGNAAVDVPPVPFQPLGAGALAGAEMKLPPMLQGVEEAPGSSSDNDAHIK